MPSNVIDDFKKKILPYCLLITPNKKELTTLLNTKKITSNTLTKQLLQNIPCPWILVI